jgi:preprotein translocase subunit SecE
MMRLADNDDHYDPSGKDPLLPTFNDNKRIRLSEKCLEPTSEWTSSQIRFVILQTVLTSIICFGVNFGLATLAMYGNEPPTLFQFPVPMTGNYAITIGLETTLNWFISGSLMTLDVVNGKVAPIDPQCIWFWPKTGSRTEWMLNLGEIVAPMYTNTSTCTKVNIHSHRLLPWILGLYLTLFPVCVGISYFCWGLDGYKVFPWQGEIITGVLGVIIAVITIPFWAMIALGSIGSRYLHQ